DSPPPPHRTTSPAMRHQIRTLAAILLTVVMTAGLVAPAAAGTVAPSLETELMALTNAERTNRGLPELRGSLQMARIAREWSNTMATEQNLYHRPNLGQAVDGNWQRIGENVGVGPNIPRIHQAFMDSPGHKANVLGDYTHVGVGVVEHDGRLWLTLNFLKGSGDFPVYRDVATTTHRTSIEGLFRRATTAGCQEARYCPNGSVTRAQMATFLAKDLGLAPRTPEGYDDVSSRNVHYGNVGAVTAAGIATGCGSRAFCPDRPITRAEMAEWVAAAMRLSPVTPNFDDVAPSMSAAGAIGALQKAGVVGGCTATSYCPNASVNRGQMATFLTKAWS
ncbi:MAG: S-layer homology domain-containing protein, partial [Nitriliruptor sp.]